MHLRYTVLHTVRELLVSRSVQWVNSSLGSAMLHHPLLHGAMGGVGGGCGTVGSHASSGPPGLTLPVVEKMAHWRH